MTLNKKVVPALLLLGLTAAPATVQAQSFDWGIVAGLNMSRLKVSGDALQTVKDNGDYKAGWYVGPKVYFNTVIGLGIDASLQYSERKLQMQSKSDVVGSETETYRTIEIPINLRYNIGLGKTLGVYVSTGPQFGFALQNMNWGNVGTGYNFSRENMNTTWNVGAGLRLMQHLEVGIGYNFAIGPVGKMIVGSNKVGTSDDKELKYKANTLQVQVAYVF